MAKTNRNPFASIKSIKGINQRRYAVRVQLEDARKKSSKPDGFHLNQPEIDTSGKKRIMRYETVDAARQQLSRCNGGIKSFGAADYIAAHSKK